MEDLVALAITWIFVFVAHWAAGRTKLTPVLWFLAMGCLGVNLGILPKEPGIFMRDLAEIGIIVIMFALGFEENSEAFLRSVRRSWGIALFGALAPFAIKLIATDIDTGTGIAMVTDLDGDHIPLSGNCFSHPQGQFIGLTA